ncbi:MAG: hypothetical protein COA79_18915 [Planctomycetota bacterium]|nr:MAG: hypothetical protein COA79_18915 [Planctomycetota bacterium]
MNSEDKTQLNFGNVIFYSILFMILGYTIDETFRWTNPLNGFASGVIHALIIMSSGWVITSLPWIILIFVIYKKSEWVKFRTAWSLAPSICIFIIFIGNLCLTFPTPNRRFEIFAKSQLPTNITNLEYEFSGGGIADYGDTYYFCTTPKEVNRIINEMNLTVEEYFDNKSSEFDYLVLPNCPAISSWKGAIKYSYSKGTWFYYLITNKSKTQVYIYMGSI